MWDCAEYTLYVLSSLGEIAPRRSPQQHVASQSIFTHSATDMSKRLADRFADCRAAKRTAFVGFVTAGYPTLDATVPALLELEKNGCDVIELGVPFSDPMADGSVIEAASVVALKNGVVYSDVLKYAAEARKKGLKVPMLLMGYYNSFLAAGVEETCKASAEAGVDGFIIVDLPVEEGWRVMSPAAARNNLSLVPLASPTSGPERIAQATAAALNPIPGMVYVVSLLGTTGMRDEEAAAAKKRLIECKGVVESIRDAAVKLGVQRHDLPVVVGFGITSRAHVEEFGAFADGCVVGSKIVQEIGRGGVAAAGKVVLELSGGALGVRGHGQDGLLGDEQVGGAAGGGEEARRQVELRVDGLRRPLHPRDADGRAQGARGGVEQVEGRPRLQGGARDAAARLHRRADAALPREAALGLWAARRSG